MKGFTRRWKTIVMVSAALILGAAGLVTGDRTEADAADTTFVYAGAGSAGIAIELFLPDSVIINKGDTVEFVNPYEEPHTITYLTPGDSVPSEFAPYNPEVPDAFDGSTSFSTGLFNKDQHLPVTFLEGGKYTFFCLLHPGMDVDVTVVGEGAFVPPQGANSPEVKQIIEEGLAVGEAASAEALKAVNATNASATDDWFVETGPSVPFEGATVDVMRFLAPEINIGVGDTVTWRNEYGVPHTVTFLPPGPPPEGFDPFVNVIPGSTFEEGKLFNALISVAPPFGGVTDFSLTFNKAGTYSYICVLHVDQGMAGVVNVGTASPGTGGGGITPPSTGDAGLLDRSSGSWMMLAGAAMLLLSFTGGVMLARRAS